MEFSLGALVYEGMYSGFGVPQPLVPGRPKLQGGR